MVTTFVGSGFFLIQTVRQSQAIHLVKDGTATCFKRVFQTYTAHLLGTTQSAYLQSGFTNLTEECFGDAIHYGERIELGLSSEPMKILNNLASDTHWFHQQLTDSSLEKILESGVRVGSIGQRFRELESSKNELLNQFSQMLSSLSGRIQIIRFIFYSVSLGLFALILSDIISFRNRRRQKLLIEDQARSLSENYIGGDHEAIDSLLYRAFEESDLQECANLYEQYRMELYRGEESVGQSQNDKVNRVSSGVKKTTTPSRMDLDIGERQDHVARSTPLSPFVKKEGNEQLIEDLWNEWEEEENVVHLDGCLANLMGRYGEKIFSHGVKLDLGIDEEVYVQGSLEVVDEVLYHLMTSVIERIKLRKQREAVNSRSENVEEVKFNLSFSLRKNGPSTVLEVVDNAQSLPEDFLQGISANSVSEVSAYPIELQASLMELTICRELVKELGGEISFSRHEENNYVKVFFNTARKFMTVQSVELPDEKGQLVSLKKGTKKEILDEIKKSSFSNQKDLH